MKTPSPRFVSPLARVAGKAPANLSEMWTLRRRAWRESGVVVVRPEELADDFARQALVNAATRLFGARPSYPESARHPQPQSQAQSSSRKEPTP